MGRTDEPVGQDASDAELLAACATDPAAFGAFHRRHAPGVLARLREQMAGDELAHAVCAETFARALERAGLYDPRRDGGAAAWLGKIAAPIVADGARWGRVEDRARRRLGMPPGGRAGTAAEQVERDLVEAAARRRDARRVALALRRRW